MFVFTSVFFFNSYVSKNDYVRLGLEILFVIWLLTQILIHVNVVNNKNLMCYDYSFFLSFLHRYKKRLDLATTSSIGFATHSGILLVSFPLL